MDEVAGWAADTEGGARASDGAAVDDVDFTPPPPKKLVDSCCVAVAAGKPLLSD